MVKGPKSAEEAVRLLRKAARRANRAWSVGPVTGQGGRARGKGSHVIWGLYDGDTMLAQGSVTTHPGDMSWTVTKGV